MPRLQLTTGLAGRPPWLRGQLSEGDTSAELAEPKYFWLEWRPAIQPGRYNYDLPNMKDPSDVSAWGSDLIGYSEKCSPLFASAVRRTTQTMQHRFLLRTGQGGCGYANLPTTQEHCSGGRNKFGQTTPFTVASVLEALLGASFVTFHAGQNAPGEFGVVGVNFSDMDVYVECLRQTSSAGHSIYMLGVRGH